MDQDLRNLRKNTAIIAVATIGSKGVTFILAPLYSHFLSTAEYGVMDILSTTISLLFPILCFDIFEATFRYTSDKKYESQKVLNTSLLCCLPVCILSFFLTILGIHVLKTTNYYYLSIPFCVCLYSLTSVLAQYLRGKQKILEFAFSGVVSAVSLLALTLFFMIVMHMGLIGWVYANCISKIIELIYLFIADKNYSNISLKKYDKKYLKEFMVYALPLMPTATMWWIMNMSDRYVLALLLGVSATGIYAVSAKIPSILSVFENVFYQAWQTTAINRAEDENRDSIFSNVFQNYLIVMIIGLLGLLTISKPLVIWLFDKSYHEAWIYMPVLIIGVVIHALSGNLGSLYAVYKRTKGALISTFLGAIINIVLNFLIVPFVGIMGAALTTVFGYLVTLVYRWFDTKKFVKISINIRETILILMAATFQLILFYIDGLFSYLVRFAVLIIIMLWKRKVLLSIVKG